MCGLKYLGNTENRKETSGVDIGNILEYKVILVGIEEKEANKKYFEGTLEYMDYIVRSECP